MAEATQTATAAARTAAPRGAPQSGPEEDGDNPFQGVVNLLKRGDLIFALGLLRADPDDGTVHRKATRL